MPGNDLYSFREILAGIKRKPSENDQVEGEAMLKEFLKKKNVGYG
jgi:hypothetical protein